MKRIGFGWRTVACVALAVMALAGCAAPAAPAPGATAAPPTAVGTAGNATTAPATAAAATVAPATAGSAKVAAVDLVFTGAHPVTAKGSAGACTMGTRVSDGGAVFGFGAVDADYAGLGDGFYVDEDAASGKLSFKWPIKQGVAYFGYFPSGGATLSADHHTLTLDADLATGQSQDPEHVTGTIFCP